MKRSTRGCGCAIAVLVLLLGAGSFGFWKYGLPWLRSRPPKPSGELQVHVLDVGPIEGDSILIISPAGKSVLIDAGDAGKGKVVLDALKRYKVERLDYFIATHPHPDHIGAADEVLSGIKVANVIDNGVDLSTPAPAAPAKPKKGKAVAPPPPPPKKSKTKGVNNFFDEYRDALKQNGAQYEKAAPGKKYDLGGGAILTVLAPSEPFFTKDQMKIGHHGSKYATSENFVKRVQPEAAIISDGAWNRYGHPGQSVLDRLKAANAKVWRTDLQGEVTITTKGRGDSGKLYEIKTAKETKEDVWAGREAMKDDSSRSGFIAYGDFGPPPKPKTEKPKKK